VFIIFLHKKNRTSSSNGSLVIPVKLKVKWKFRMAAMLSFRSLNTNYLNKLWTLYGELLPYIIWGSYTKCC